MMSLFINLNPKPSLKPNSPIRFFSNPKRLNLALNCYKIPLQSPNSLHFNDSISRTLQTLDSLKPYVLSNRRQILSGWLCSFVSVSSLSVIVSDLGKLASLVGGFDGAVGLKHEVLGLGFLVLARSLGDYWRQAFLWEASLRSAREIRVKVFRDVLESDLGVFGGRNSGVLAGDMAYRLTAEASDVADTVYALLNTTVPSILQLSAMARQMLTISPVLSFISAMMIPCTALVIAYLGEEHRKISKNANLSVAALSAYLNEILPAIPFVKANNAELCENARFRRFAQADYDARIRKKKMKVFIPQIIKIMYFGSSFLFFVSSLAISRGSFDGRRMVSFITSLFFLVEPIQDIGKAYNELKQGEPAIERLFDLTKFEMKIKDKPNAIDLSHVTGEVRFCDVSFKYGDDMPLVLNGLNLHIKAGETVALVGLSGGGKSTLAKLLVRLYDPFSGSILIDSHNVKDIRLESLRRYIGLVSQDIVGTVAENIGYRDLMIGIDMDRVTNVARIANAEEFIRLLPNGYETEVGPTGSTFSGGQRQRLAIARALYHDPSILILDEATSALDSKSELLVRQALQRLMENHTVVVIAHRLETVLMANRVFLLDSGNLKELCRSTLLSDPLEPLLSKGVLI